MYLFLLLVGAIGFLAMTFLGLAHGVGGGHHGLLGGHGHSGGHTPSLGHGHGNGALAHPHGHGTPAHTHNHGTAHQTSDSGSGPGSSVAWKLLLAVSPLDVFSLALGAGATGLLLAPFLSGSNLVWVALLGAVVFDFAVVKPLLGLMLRFVSKPSEGLEGLVSSIAEAVTPFDSQGRGLVKLTLDGQLVQLLANLDASEKETGVSVTKGDRVVVVEVDPARNTCTVSRELAPSLADDVAASKSQASTKRSI